MKNYVNSNNFHGSIISRNVKRGHQINFVKFLSGSQMIHAKRRNMITTVDPEEEKK